MKSYFDMMKVLGKPGYDNAMVNDKAKFFFMVNRQLTRVYPIIAATMGHIKMDPVCAMDFWHNHLKMIKKMGGNPFPKEMYAKLTTIKKKKQKHSKEAEVYTMQRFKLSPKDMMLLKEFGSKELIKYLNSVDAMLTEKVVKK